MTQKELYDIRYKYFHEKHKYERVYCKNFKFKILDNIMNYYKSGRGNNASYNDVIISLDTETSKSHKNLFTVTYKKNKKTGDFEKVEDVIPVKNHLVCWSITIRAFDTNITTVYGRTPRELTEFLDKMQQRLGGDETYIYVHNLSYDWVFIRKFMFERFAFPEKQLNTKSHYPIMIKFQNGLILKDSLILAQRSLEKWAEDLDVEHKKATGSWDYDKIRNQSTYLYKSELGYQEFDTLSHAECIQKTKDNLNKKLFAMPYTATGIPREEVRKIAKSNGFRTKFKQISLDYKQYLKMTKVYHGGYTHANRFFLNMTHTGDIRCFDFASSYPYTMLSEKFPMSKFIPIETTYDKILKLSDNYAFMFKLILVNPRLKKDINVEMPALQFSKCVHDVNPILDNGRILAANYVEIYINEIDLEVILSQYDYDKIYTKEVEYAEKYYLPRWFTDYIFKCYYDKCTLKHGDPVIYSIAKAKLNSLYGMCVQKSIRDNLLEDYETGDFYTDQKDNEEEYEKYLNRQTTFLPYQWGVWVTAYAFRNLFELGKCFDTWLYSDTDSCYGIDWDMSKVDEYNNNCISKLKANNYGAVQYNGQCFWLGVAESDHKDLYSEFRYCGAKRYCGRKQYDNKLYITVAGVPKKGVKCLNDDISNFTDDFIFDGGTTGKKHHWHIFTDNIEIDKNGNEVGDSIDLTPDSYRLSSVHEIDWETLFNDEIEVQVYEET